MNRNILLAIFSVFLVLFSAALGSAVACTLSASMINQDPYPAIPGDYVKVVFQLDGVSNPGCGKVVFELIEKFPFSLDPGQNSTITLRGGTFASDFKSSLVAPYKIRVSPDAMDGDNPIEVRFYSGFETSESFSQTKQFNITVQDVRTDFELSIRDYQSATNTLTFEILNIGEHDVEALTIEVPEQENIRIKGTNRNIVGSLDSNEDTTFTFEAIPRDGEIRLKILYTDETNERREKEETVRFSSEYFTGRVSDQKSTSWLVYVLIIVVLIIAIYIWRRNKKKKHMQLHKHHHSE